MRSARNGLANVIPNRLSLALSLSLTIINVGVIRKYISCCTLIHFINKYLNRSPMISLQPHCVHIRG